ncbi:bifunctional glutamate N-acetyltransferase/amino-acid acetyltransferase ArgJ [Desulfovibrio sp. OttesenSCG-928-A18]|nr:bifunctional glutamate N-acetyltransferase/amino-acid acetyltransferase ArgJ [Desulfovibrio sp. OttesenSCG-928-A18]
MKIVIPQGFTLAVTSAGFKTPGKTDLALAVSDVPAAAAGVFTRNQFKAAPVQIGQHILHERDQARAVLINTGQANACTGAEGLANCRLTQEMVAVVTGLAPSEILPASTGVIGAQLRMDAWQQAIPRLVENMGGADIEDFASAIMTTDAFPKYAGEQFRMGAGMVSIAAVAKGAGMICPNMATMLSVVLCDAAVDSASWRELFPRAVAATFNRATVDGDTSTNDTLYALANGVSGVQIQNEDDFAVLEAAVTRVLAKLAYMLVQDGEGATKVLHIRVSGADCAGDAEQCARTVGHSQLVKTAMYGRDANWGRIVAAVGRCGVPFNPADLVVNVCGVELFKREQPTTLDFDSLLSEALAQRDINIDISLGDGPGVYTLLASDLSHEYVSINADYRS